MKINKDKLVFEDFEHKLDIKYSPEIKSSKDFDKADHSLANLLSWSRNFSLTIIEIRTKLKLKNLYKYPKKATVKNTVGLLFKLHEDKRDLLKKESQQLSGKFKLTENWVYPIEIAVLTNVLLVPKWESIGIHRPFNDREIKDPLINHREGQRVLSYPSIYFTRRVSPNELKRWIDANTSFIKLFQNKLPEQKTVRREQKTIFWAQVVWILKQDGINSWTKMSEKIEEWVDKAFPEEERFKDPDDFTQIPPGSTDLEKYYKRFIDSLSSLNI